MKKILLTAICVVLCAGAAQATIDDYVAYWQFEPDDGTDYGSADSSANGYDWDTATGRNNATGIAGNAAKHYYTTTVDARLRAVSTTAKIANADSFTASMWIQPPTTGDGGMNELFSMWTETDDNRKFVISWMSWNGRIALALSQDGDAEEGLNSSDTSTIASDSTKWYHLAVTVDLTTGSDDVFIYLTESSATSIVTAGSKDFAITSLYDPTAGNMASGQDGTTTTSLEYEGLIDELVFYDRALSSSEIQSLFNLGKSGSHIPEPATLGVLLTGLVLFSLRRKR